jgi:hypothetical protein
MEGTAAMRIEILTRYSTYLPGAVVECDDETARKLIRDGVARRDGPTVERAVREPHAERADLTPRRRRREVSQPDSPDATDG